MRFFYSLRTVALVMAPLLASSCGKIAVKDKSDQDPPPIADVKKDSKAGLKYAQIVSGREHTCALSKNGTVTCWGNNQVGQLGSVTPVYFSPPVMVPGISQIKAIVAELFDHICALTAAGSMKCWGNNESGQLGDGTTVNRSVPVDVQALTGVAAMFLERQRTCALTAVPGLEMLA